MTSRWANPINNNRLYDLEGTLLPGGSVQFYAADTSTPLAVYSDPELTVSLGSFINADAFGLLPDFHLAAGTQYKMVAYDAIGGAGGDGAVKWTCDDVFSLDSHLDARLDDLESAIGVLSFGRNSVLNAGCSVKNLDADGDVIAAPSVSSTLKESQSKAVYAQSNYTSGTATIGYSTDVESGAYMAITGYSSIFSDSFARGLFTVSSGEASRLINAQATARIKVWHNCGSAKNATITVAVLNARDGAPDTYTIVGSSSPVSVPDQEWTEIEFTVPGMGNCSNGIVIFATIVGGVVTSKEFRFTSAMIGEGGVLPAFSETDPGIAKGALNALTFAERYANNEIAQFAQRDAGSPWLNGIGAITTYTSGSGNWTVPAGVYRVKYTVTGGGGGGGGRDGGGPGSDGGDSTLNGTITAGGGIGGSNSNPADAGPPGGAAAGGDINIPGGGGAAGTGLSTGTVGGASYWGGGGAGCGPASNGIDAGAYGAGGGGAQGASGAAASGSAGGTCIGVLSVTPGQLIPYSVGAGGAGGTGTRTGGAGKDGIIVLEY